MHYWADPNGPGLFLLKWHTQLFEQAQCHVIGFCGGYNRYVQTANLIDLVVINLGKNDMLPDPEGVIAAPVKPLGRDAAKVSNPGQGDIDQSRQEMIHPVTAQGDPAADGHPLTELKPGNGLLGPGHHGLLTGNQGQLIGSALNNLGILYRLTEPHVQDNLLNPGDLHGVFEAAGFLQPGSACVRVIFFQGFHVILQTYTVLLLGCFNSCAAVLADPYLGAVFKLFPADPNGLGTLRADQHQVGNVDKRFLLDNLAGLGRVGRLHVTLDHVDPLHNGPVFPSVYLQDLADPALILPGDHFHLVIHT